MRTRKTIKKDLDDLSERMDIGVANFYIVEVLLDIRDLLNKEK